MKVKIGAKIVAGLFYKELAKGEVVALAENGIVVRMSEKFRKHAKGDLVMLTEHEILPVDETVVHRRSDAGGHHAKPTQAMRAAPATGSTMRAAKAAKTPGDPKRFPVGSQVLFGSKKTPVLGEVLRHGQVNYAIKALETHGWIKKGATVYFKDVDVREVPPKAVKATKAAPADAVSVAA